MNTKTKRKVGSIVYNVIVCFFGLIMLYPLVWMVMSSFKETSTIFTTAGSLIPEKATLENYVNGWKGFGKVSFGTFFSNSMFISVIATVGTVISSSLVAYGFSRCKFKGRGLLFAAMLVSMMLPAQVLMIPQYLWYQKLGWVGTYLPLIVPYFFAIQGFFVYLILNFIDGIPKDLDEAARNDTDLLSGKIRIFAVADSTEKFDSGDNTAGIFSFMWRWDDFLSALLYVKESVRYPASLALKLFCDPGSSSDYGAMFAMSTLSIIPAVTIFIVFQKYLVEGIATSGLKG